MLFRSPTLTRVNKIFIFMWVYFLNHCYHYILVNTHHDMLYYVKNYSGFGLIKITNLILKK